MHKTLQTSSQSPEDEFFPGFGTVCTVTIPKLGEFSLEKHVFDVQYVDVLSLISVSLLAKTGESIRFYVQYSRARSKSPTNVKNMRKKLLSLSGQRVIFPLL